MKRKNIVNNKNLNSLLKNSKKKQIIKEINNEDIIVQHNNINNNYKSIYFFNDETFDNINTQYYIKNLKHFNFKDFNDEKNSINKFKKTKDELTINNNNLNLDEKFLSINNEEERKANDDNKNKTIQNFTDNKSSKGKYINNSFKIINESKYNNKSKVTIYLISDGDE